MSENIGHATPPILTNMFSRQAITAVIQADFETCAKKQNRYWFSYLVLGFAFFERRNDSTRVARHPKRKTPQKQKAVGSQR
jgi:hypothetical protein